MLKRDLIVAGVNDPSEEQAIMDNSNKNKIYQLESNQHQETFTNMTSLKAVKPEDYKDVVKNVTSVNLTKGFFKRIETGELDITLSTNKQNSINSIVPEVLKRMSVSDTATKSACINHLSSIQQNNSSSSNLTLDSGSPKSSSKSTNKKSESIFESINTMVSSTNTSFSNSSKSVKQINNPESPKFNSTMLGSRPNRGKHHPMSTSSN
ncbi:unnamed protein product [Ambrosiozyma monospora]|uniref:Unnamed protein product n=1 Tax=Ambrosiozyma monospora TaxID=43982 RepID=A0ACB5TU07_AMBMO|nr:unnamed protein product [Ambrosiozyma monospora]